MTQPLARRRVLVPGRLTYFPDYQVYYYHQPRVYYQVRHSRYLQLAGAGTQPTEAAMRAEFGPPPDHPSVGSLPYLPQDIPPTNSDPASLALANLDLDAISEEVVSQQQQQQQQRQQQRQQAKQQRKASRRKIWSGVKRGFSDLFRTRPCEEWRSTGSWEADRYRDSWSGSSLNGCCSQAGEGCPVATSPQEPCRREAEANPQFNDACATILLAEARQRSYQKRTGRLDPVERCSSIMREAKELLGDNDSWFRENCTQRRGRMPAGVSLPELEESAGPTRSEALANPNDPFAEQDALRAELFRDSGALVQLDRGPILDRVCQMCQEDETSFPPPSWQGDLGLGMVGIDSGEARAQMLNMRRGQY